MKAERKRRWPEGVRGGHIWKLVLAWPVRDERGRYRDWRAATDALPPDHDPLRCLCPIALRPFTLDTMDTRTASPPDALAATAIIGDDAFHGQQDTMPDKISAYYSLVFPNFTYYLQTLTVTIGRRCIPNSTASSSEQAQVDVDLGPLKSVSRLHAKIEYGEEDERFVLSVLGRNGAWVDGAWFGKGSKVPLGERYVVGPDRIRG